MEKNKFDIRNRLEILYQSYIATFLFEVMLTMVSASKGGGVSIFPVFCDDVSNVAGIAVYSILFDVIFDVIISFSNVHH